LQDQSIPLRRRSYERHPRQILSVASLLGSPVLLELPASLDFRVQADHILCAVHWPVELYNSEPHVDKSRKLVLREDSWSLDV